MSNVTNKFVNRMFRRVGGVVWDPLTGGTGLRTDQGIYTFKLNADGTSEVSVNPFDDFGMALPAFATQTVQADVRPGDIIVGDSGIIGWVVSVTEGGAYKVKDHNGFERTYTPPKVNVLAQANGVLVVRNLLSLTGGEQNAQNFAANLLPLLALSGGDGDGKLEKLLPLLLMTSAGGGAGAATANPLQAMLPLLLMKNGGLGGSGDKLDKLLPLLMISGGGGLGGNPMLLMAMMGDTDLFGMGSVASPRTGPRVPTLNPVTPPPLNRL